MTNKVGRNDPCLCGSGKKYKKCCLRKQEPSLPIRPRQHVLDTLAIDFITSQLPASWSREEVSRDYGKDIRVEVFDDHPVVGHVAINQEFVIQSKGHEKFTVVHTNQIAQQLKVSTLNYLTSGLLPSLLVAYSEDEKKACYLWLKPYVDQVLDKKDPDWRNTAGDSEITIHIPLDNVLDKNSIGDIRQHVADYHANLLRQQISGSYLTTKPSALAIPKTVPHRLRHPQIIRCLHRLHLTNELNQVLKDSNVFLHAGAGYGKTWLIHDLITTYEFPIVVWFTFDKTLFGGIQLIRELATELYRQTKTTGEVTLTHLEEMGTNVRFPQVLSVFLDELSQLKSVVLLILEDLHFVSDAEVGHIINSFLSQRFTNLQIVLTSRYPLPFKQAKLKSQGLLTVIDQEAMGFSLPETQKYLVNNLGLSLSAEQINDLHRRTGEWVAALGLAANVLEEKSSDRITGLFEQINGYEGNVYEFFAEEVYAELEEEEQKLLNRLGLVHLIEPDVVNLFTNAQNGGAILRKLHEHNTFLIKHDRNSYKFHSLFAEFLEAKFLDDEGLAAIEYSHRLLAQYYHSRQDWYSATEHAAKGKDYALAVDGLGKIAPASIDLGYGLFFLKFVELLPEEYLTKSADLQEMIGRAALQIGQLERATQAFSIARTLYEDSSDIDRVDYFLAEAELDRGGISRQEFVDIARNIANKSYQRNENFFGCQAELRAIELAQTLTAGATDEKESVKDLIGQSDELIQRLDKLGQEYNLIKSKALSAKAHLLLQKIITELNEESGRYRLREEMGHPVPATQKIQALRSVHDDLQIFSQLHQEAEKLVGDRNDVQLAFIRMQFIDDNVTLANTILLNSLISGSAPPSQFADFTETRMRQWFLPLLDECRRIFAKNQIMEGLTNVYRLAAEIYDSLGEIDFRNQMAMEASKIATEYGYIDLAEKAQKLIQGKHTYSWVLEKANKHDQHEAIAGWDERDKQRYVEVYLRAFDKDVDEKRRHTVEVAVNDMVGVAQQKRNWCQHLSLVEDLEHEKSLNTMHREIPNKYVICEKLGHHSPNSGKSFEELWPFFKGIFCLGCPSRNPSKSI